MSRFSTFLFGAVTGAALLYVAMHYHIVRATDGTHIVAKQPARLSETYIDARTFTAADWTAHPLVATALVQAGKQNLLGDAAQNSLQQSLNQLLPEWPKE